jgi:excisionase family DNA binding protein
MVANPDRLLTPEQVARRLACKRSLILRLIRQRRLTGVRIGHGWRIEPQAIAEYIAAQRQDAAVAEAPGPDDRQMALFDPEDGAQLSPLTVATSADTAEFHNRDLTGAGEYGPLTPEEGATLRLTLALLADRPDPPAAPDADAAKRLSLASAVVTTLAAGDRAPDEFDSDAGLRLTLAASLVRRIANNEDERIEAQP